MKMRVWECPAAATTSALLCRREEEQDAVVPAAFCAGVLAAQVAGQVEHTCLQRPRLTPASRLSPQLREGSLSGPACDGHFPVV